MKNRLLAQIAPSLRSGRSGLQHSAGSDPRVSPSRSASLGSTVVLPTAPVRLACPTLTALEEKWLDALEAYQAAKRARRRQTREFASDGNVIATRKTLCQINRQIDEHQWKHG